MAHDIGVSPCNIITLQFKDIMLDAHVRMRHPEGAGTYREASCTQLALNLHQLAESLGRAVDAKDAWTCSHSEDVAAISRVLALNLGLSPSLAELVHLAGHLHDIGKIGIPDAILQKPGPLSHEEFAIIRQHPVIGESIVLPVKALGGRNGVARMIRHHHERYDGRGYPDGLRGNDIPLGARILAVADSLSAMMQERPYKTAMEFPDAESEILGQSGLMYDPRVVAAFRDGRAEIRSWMEGVRLDTGQEGA